MLGDSSGLNLCKLALINLSCTKSAATASLAGERASTRSFGTSITSASTATGASDPNLRRRPSSRSVRSIKYED